MAVPSASEDASAVPITRKLAEFVHNAKWDDIQPILNIVQCGFLDYIGLTSYTVNHVDSSPAFIEAINQLSADGPGSVLGLSRRYQPQYSALLNGTLIHSMDWDDTNSTASLHPGASAISAALAAAELEMAAGRQVTGRDFYVAVAVGYEVTCRLGRSVSDVLHREGFHPTCVAGVFGASATVAKLAGFSVEQIDNLFGVVGSMSSGSLQCFENGGWNKRFHPGIAAHNAMLGAQFVKAGMIGAARAIEGSRGFLYSYGRMSKPDARIIEDLNSFWETSNTAIKPYPCCRLVHGPIEAAYALRKLFPDMYTVPDGAKIEVTVGGKAHMGVGSTAPNKFRPTNIVEGQFSLFYQFAVAWLYGTNGWDAYDRLEDEKVLALCQKIVCHKDESLREGSLVTVAKLGDKRVQIDYPLGEPENPIGLPEVENKVRPMLQKVYGEKGSQQLLTGFYGLSDQEDLSVFIKSLRV